MATRILYLRYHHSGLSGQTATAGRSLVKALRSRFDQVVVAHCIMKDDILADASDLLLQDVIKESEIKDGDFNVIYCEGGPLSVFSKEDNNNGRKWKIEERLARLFVEKGNIIVFADIDYNLAKSSDAQSVAEFAGFSFVYGDEHKSPVYFRETNPRDDSCIRIDTAKMRGVEPWLQPAFDGISQLIVESALEIRPWQDALAYASSESVGTLCNDTWWAPPFTAPDLMRLRYHENGPMAPGLSGPFASIKRLGLGFVVAVTGIVSSDRIINKNHDNASWIIQLIETLQNVISENAEEASYRIFRGVRLFLSHRSIDKPIVYKVGEELKRKGPRIWFDKEQIVMSDSIGLSINKGLSECSHFVLFWSVHCVDARWVEYELGSAISSCVEQAKPIFVVQLDDTALPQSLNQFLRIKCPAKPEEIAAQIAGAILRIRDRQDFSKHQ